MVKHIAFTLYPVLDMAEARRFYEKDIGLTLTKNFKDSWVEYHLENGAFALSTMIDGVRPASDAGGSIAFEVDDLDKVMTALRAKRVAVKVEPFVTPVCRMAIVLDPDGNAVCLHQKKS